MLPRPRTLAPPPDPPRALDLTGWALRRGRAVRVLVQGDAMGATVSAGEWLLVDPVTPSLLLAGDVVLAALGAGPEVLRVVSIELRRSAPGDVVAAWCTLRGDGGGEARVVEGAQVIGRVVGVDREGVILPLAHCSARPTTVEWVLRFGLGALALVVALAALLRR